MARDLKSTLDEFIELVVERKMREADVSDGSRVPHGSSKHIKDLEIRIADLGRWRDKQCRCSEARANYARVISRLKGELASARRINAKNKPVKEAIDEPGPSAQERWEVLASGTEDHVIARIVNAFKAAATPRDLGKIKKNVEKMMDAGQMPASVTDGFVVWLFDRRKAEFKNMEYTPRSAADARIDRMARTIDSDGRRSARKMR